MIPSRLVWVISVIGALAIPTASVVLRSTERLTSSDTVYEEWATTDLAGLAPNAVLFAVGDLDLFAYSYLTKVKGFRSDVTIIDSQDCLTPPELQILTWPRPTGAALEAINRERIARFLEAGRVVYGPYFGPQVLPAGWTTRPDGFHHRLVKEGEGAADFVDRRVEAEAFFHTVVEPLDAPLAGWLPLLRYWIANQIGLTYARAVDAAIAAQDQTEAGAQGTLLAAWANYSPLLLARLGEAYAKAGPKNYAQSYHLFEESIHLSRRLWLPELALSWFWMGFLDGAAEDWLKGLYHMDRAIAIRPTLAQAHLYLGRYYAKLGKQQAADAAKARAIRLDPTLAAALQHDEEVARPRE